MNKAILMGRLTRDPEVRYTQGQDPMAVARYTLAVDRRGKEEADFISCVAFRKAAEFAEKYLKKGTKILVAGRIQTGSYTNREGRKIYTTDIIVEEQEFAESKAAGQNKDQEGNKPSSQSNAQEGNRPTSYDDDGFMNIPDGIDEELPFS